jgi:hypothetical protein
MGPNCQCPMLASFQTWPVVFRQACIILQHSTNRKGDSLETDDCSGKGSQLDYRGRFLKVFPHRGIVVSGGVQTEPDEVAIQHPDATPLETPPNFLPWRNGPREKPGLSAQAGCHPACGLPKMEVMKRDCEGSGQTGNSSEDGPPDRACPRHFRPRLSPRVFPRNRPFDRHIASCVGF